MNVLVADERETILSPRPGSSAGMFTLNGNQRVRENLYKQKNDLQKQEKVLHIQENFRKEYDTLVHTGRSIGIEERIAPFKLTEHLKIVGNGGIYDVIDPAFLNPRWFRQTIWNSKAIQLGAYKHKHIKVGNYIQDYTESQVTKEAAEVGIYYIGDTRQLHEICLSVFHEETDVFIENQIHRFPIMSLQGILDAWIIYTESGIRLHVYEQQDDFEFKAGNILFCRNIPVRKYIR